MLLVRRFAFFALEDQHASCMNCGTGPPCHRMDTPVCIGGDFSRRFEAGAGESAFKEGFIPQVAAMPCFSPTRGVLSPPSSLRPFAFKVSALRCRSCDGLARPSRALPARGGTQLGAQPARMGCASVCREDLCRCLSSRRPCRRRVCVLCFQTPQRVGSANPVFLRVAAGGAWPPASTRGVLLHPLGGHHRLPPQDVHGGGAPSRFFLQHSGGRTITSLVKVDRGPSHGSIPRAPQLFGGGKRAMLRLHLFGFDGFGAASNAASRRQAGRGCPSTARATVAPCAGPLHP
jgi:hypothetical protein